MDGQAHSHGLIDEKRLAYEVAAFTASNVRNVKTSLTPRQSKHVAMVPMKG